MILKTQSKSFEKFLKHMKFFLIHKKEKHMTHMVLKGQKWEVFQASILQMLTVCSRDFSETPHLIAKMMKISLVASLEEEARMEKEVLASDLVLCLMILSLTLALGVSEVALAQSLGLMDNSLI